MTTEDWGLEFVGGWISGVVSTIAGHPFDTMKVRLQLQQSGSVTNGMAIGNGNVVKNGMFKTKPVYYKGAWDCFLKTVKTEGVQGLFKGMLSPVLGQGLVNAVVFGVQRNLMKHMNEKKITDQVIAGAAAGAVQSFVLSPIELSKVRLQLQGQGVKPSDRQIQPYRGSVQCLFKIFQQEGVRGFYRGLLMTLYRDIPGFMIYFGVNEYVKKVFRKQNRKDGMEEGEVGGMGSFIAGGAAGVSLWAACQPIDVIKSRLQADGIDGKTKYKNIIDCIRVSIREEGYTVFLKGLNVNLVRAFWVNAVLFYVEEKFRRWHKSL